MVASAVAEQSEVVQHLIQNWDVSILGRKRRETGKELWMKEPYAEGLANHSDRKSCAGTGDGHMESWQRHVQVGYRVPKRYIEESADTVFSLRKSKNFADYRYSRQLSTISG